MKNLLEVEEKFILHWGEMGSSWGINRTTAQMHALLYLSENPLSAEEIAETLEIARSNVSAGLKELQSWHIIKIVQQIGDRRSYYQAEGDVWQMFRHIISERKRRELDPIMGAVEQCNNLLQNTKMNASYTASKINDVHQIFQLMDGFYKQLNRLPEKQFQKFMRLCNDVNKVMSII